MQENTVASQFMRAIVGREAVMVELVGCSRDAFGPVPAWCNIFCAKATLMVLCGLCPSSCATFGA